TMTGDSLSFRTPEFVNSTTEQIQNSIAHLTQAMTDSSILCESLARIRKIVLWTMPLLSARNTHDILKEYMRIGKEVLKLSVQCRLQTCAPEPDASARLMKDCEQLEKHVLRKLKDTLQGYDPKQNRLPSFERLLDLQKSLNNRLSEADEEAKKAEHKAEISGSEIDKDPIQFISQRRQKWVKIREMIEAVLTIVEEAIVLYEGA
ncbi:MAG: hypothetical protein K2X81_19800, partial [Candidatus Obscuribacterales bacterium]|nr:hypothetical protein [Candidatus Obscuribacterales bacterium]